MLIMKLLCYYDMYIMKNKRKEVNMNNMVLGWIIFLVLTVIAFYRMSITGY